MLACCIIHNFLCRVDNDDPFLKEVDRELMDQVKDFSNNQDREVN